MGDLNYEDKRDCPTGGTLILSTEVLEILMDELPNRDLLILMSTCRISRYLPYPYDRGCKCAAYRAAGKVWACLALFPNLCSLPKRRPDEPAYEFYACCHHFVGKVLTFPTPIPDSTNERKALELTASRAYLLRVAAVIGMQSLLAEIVDWFYRRDQDDPVLRPLTPEPHSPSYSD